MSVLDRARGPTVAHQPHWRAGAFAALGALVVALTAVVTVGQDVSRRRTDQLTSTADFVVTALQNNLDAIEREVLAIAGAAAASESLTAEEFRTFVDTALAAPGVLGRGVVAPTEDGDGTTDWTFVLWEPGESGPDWVGAELPSSRVLRFEPKSVFEHRVVQAGGFMRLNLGTETILVLAPAKLDQRLASAVLIDVEALRVDSMSDALADLVAVTVHGSTPTPTAGFEATRPITIGDRIYQVQVVPVAGSPIGPLPAKWWLVGGFIALGVAFVVGIGTAVGTERRRVRAELMTIRTRDTARLEFLASISHELRTPITAMTGFTQLLRDQWDDISEDDRRDLIRLADEQGAEVLAMITDLLVLTRGESGVLRLSMGAVVLSEIIGRSIAAVPAEFAHRVEADPLDLTVWADPTRLAQVVRNLVINGLKHGEGTVRVRGWRGDHDIVVRITDEGSGIPPEAIDTVFQPFSEASSTDRLLPSTGVGLYISRLLVERMGGTLRYLRDSDLSVFEIRLLPGPITDADQILPVTGDDESDVPAHTAGVDRRI